MKNLISNGLVLFVAAETLSAPIAETEAVALAELWYANEVSAKATDLPQAEKEKRLLNKDQHQVYYLLGRENLQRRRAANDDVMAYVVTFEPSGFVVIGGDDAVNPVLAFSPTRTFTWDVPQKSFLSFFLGHGVAESVKYHRNLGTTAKTRPHPNWTRCRKHLQTASGSSTAMVSTTAATGDSGNWDIDVLLPTAEWDQGFPYNATCVANNGGNNVFAGCVATAMAIQFRYHEWPRNGSGNRSYNDNDGNVRFSHSVDFSQATYDWSAMPTTNLTTPNPDVARLMYDCGVAMNMDYETDGSGTRLDAGDLNKYFRYRGTLHVAFVDMKSAVAYSIRCGLPTMINTSRFLHPAFNHCLVSCGYRENDSSSYFYLNCGWGGGPDNGWYDLDQIITPSVDLGSIVGCYPYSSPDNHAYVDPERVSTMNNGDLHHPYYLLSEGVSEVTENGVLMLKGGNYDPVKFTKAMTIKSYLGSAVLGE